MRATLAGRESLTDTITSFSFQPEGDFSYTAGQFIELTLIGHEEDGRTAKRWFTLSSSPDQPLLTITTRVGTAAHTPFKRALEKMEVGAGVDISEPLGDFVLPKLIQTPLIFVAGGIGITPFHSILQSLIHSQEQRSIQFIHTVHYENDIIFQDTFNAAEQHVTIVVDEPSETWGGLRGPLTGEMINGLTKITDDTLIYLSGPEPFVQKIQTELAAQGISNQQIILDEFQGYTDV